MAPMTKLLDKAIARMRHWPKARQDDAAEMLLAMEEQGAEPYKLSDIERAALTEAREEVERDGVASEKDVRAMWKKHGL